MTKIIIGGDFCPSSNIIPKDCFNEIATILRLTDLRIVNFECAIADASCKPIKKEGPVIQCTIEQFDQVISIEANFVTLANNHILDCGAQGLENVISACENNHIQYVGVGNNIKDIKCTCYYRNVAIINCCEQEFSIAGRNHCGANHAHPVSIYYQIQEAKKSSNCIIVIVHGGIEYYQLPSPDMQDLYRFFIDAGASVVVGHHPHCFSGGEDYHGGYIYYSLGNLFFDNGSKKHTIWNDGFLLKLEIAENGVIKKNEIIPYIQCYKEPGIKVMNGEEKSVFRKQYDNLSDIIAHREVLVEKYNCYCLTQKRHSLSRILPYSNRFLCGLYKRGLFPSFLTAKMILSRINAIRCESHRGVLTNNLEIIYKSL